MQPVSETLGQFPHQFCDQDRFNASVGYNEIFGSSLHASHSTVELLHSLSSCVPT